MADNLTKQQRSFCMSRIKRSKTKPELLLKKKLKGYLYQPKNMFGNPDFINLKKRKVLFVNGCFFHQCSVHYVEPKSNKSYWIPKIEKNVIRDKEVDIAYKNAGWQIKRVWEHELKK